MAQGAGLDLVEIQADIRPPVCKIMDYGRFKFELSKKERGNRAASKQAEMKEVRLGRSQKIDDHDVGIRVSQARRFLMEGHKVQIVQQFRGREMAHKEIAVKRFKDVIERLADISKLEQTPRLLGRKMSLILAPDKVKIEAIKRKQAREQNAEQREAEKRRQAEEDARIAALDASEAAAEADQSEESAEEAVGSQE